jgi:YD repeat-containing protein
MKAKLSKPLSLLALCLGLACAALSSVTYAQQPSNSNIKNLFINVTPVSPNAASLGKYGETPVNYYTGLPNISIPLLEIKSGSLTLPISLSYHGAGIKVDEEAPSVGLGWSLNAGGTIVRTIKGRDDFSPFGYHFSREMMDVECGDASQPCVGNPNSIVQQGKNGFCEGYIDYYLFRPAGSCYAKVNGQNVLYSDVTGENTDWEPDVYTFNIGGQAGKFVLDQKYLLNGKINILERNAMVKVKLNGDFINKGWNTTWEVTDQVGDRYFFEEKEITSSNNYGENITSWVLNKIVSPVGDEIKLFYSTGTITSLIHNSEIYHNNDKQIHSSLIQSIPDLIYEKRLSRIEFKSGYVLFEYDQTARQDVQGAARLKAIRMYTLAGSLIKEYILEHGYYNNTTSGNDFASKRLRLDRLTEQNGTVSKPPYRFSYNIQSLPVKTSFSKDHWGYFNGKPNNTLVPAYMAQFDPYPNPSGLGSSYPGANRGADPIAVKAGILEKIVYPTGGETLFEFESNDFRNTAMTPYDPDDYEINITGFALTCSPGNQQTNNPFSIPDAAGTNSKRIKINMQVTACAGITTLAGNEFTFQLINTATNSITVWTNPAATSLPYIYTEEFVLPAYGTYRLNVVRNVPNNNFAASMGVSYIIPKVLSDPQRRFRKYGGGLRIKKITESDGIAPDRITEYTYSSPTTYSGQTYQVSTGKALNYFKYERLVIINQVDPGNPNNTLRPIKVERVANSRVPFSTFGQSMAVGYSQVTVIEGGTLKTVYNFANDSSIYISNRFRMSGIPSYPVGNMNGSLLSESIYTKTGTNTYVLAKETINSYVELNRTVLKNIIIDPYLQSLGGYNGNLTSNVCNAWSCHLIMMHYYPSISSTIKTASTTTRLYSQADPNLFTETVTNYAYDNPAHLQPTRITTLNSLGEEEVTRMVYPPDYGTIPASATNALAGIKRLQDLNIVAPVIEKYTLKQNPGGTNVRVTGGQITEYWPDRPLPKAVHVLESQAPLTNFGASNRTPGSYQPDTRYARKFNFTHYDGQGNIVQQEAVEGVPTTYLWGHGGTLPIAEAVNALRGQVFYEGFEETTAGTATDQPKAGRKYKTGGYTFTPAPGSGFANGSRVAYFWRTSATDPWKYKEVAYAGGTFVALGEGTTPAQQVDEFRVFPPGAMLTTYTYDPLVGLTSATDPNGVTSYYEYDGLGRLKLIRDQDGNIIKAVQYNYKQ